MNVKVFVEAARKAIVEQNWYASLALAFALPDICSKLEYPDQSTGMRYKNWYNKYLLDKYTFFLGPKRELHVFLTADDFYALRCSYLHSGIDNITMQSSRAILEKFKFITTTRGNYIHRNQFGTTLQLQVDIFCEEICSAVEQWVNDVQGNKDVENRATQLLMIDSLDD